MDPYSRKFLWENIEYIKAGRSVILTTHSMEEAEKNCNRIGKLLIIFFFIKKKGIIVGGSLQCIGSTSYLKNKFGDKYYILINCDLNNIENVDKFIMNIFEKEGITVKLLESYGGSGRKYEISHLNSLSFAFEKIETHKKELDIFF